MYSGRGHEQFKYQDNRYSCRWSAEALTPNKSQYVSNTSSIEPGVKKLVTQIQHQPSH